MQNSMTIRVMRDYEPIATCSVSDASCSEDGVSVFLNGSFYDGPSRLDAEALLALYKRSGEAMYRDLDGVGSVTILDNEKKKVFVFTDFYNGNTFIYYSKTPASAVITNDLRQFCLTDPSPQLDRKAAERFVRHGYLPGSRTLLAGVKKLSAKRYLVFDLSRWTIVEKRCAYARPPRKAVTYDSYDAVVRLAVESAKRGRFCTAVSSGLDSNYILYQLRTHTDPTETLYTYCVGGVTGRNEVDIAREICGSYENVVLHTALVDGSSFQHLPEIVFALQGSMYEKGMFLRYELAKAIQAGGFESVILGQGVDEILQLYAMRGCGDLTEGALHYLQQIKAKVLRGYDVVPYLGPYQNASSMLIKMTGMMTQHFGVDAEFPYLRKDFQAEALYTPHPHDDHKGYHREVIRHVLPAFVTDRLNTIGGSTDANALFTGEPSYEAVRAYCRKSRWFRDKKFGSPLNTDNHYLRILCLEVFERLFLCEDMQPVLKGERDLPLLSELLAF